MKTALLAAGLAALLLSGPAHASWAENSHMRNPVYTGTNAALAQAQHRRYHRGYMVHRIHRDHRDSWDRTYR
jgi:hypothetical protein